jgi:hypothetical protein
MDRRSFGYDSAAWDKIMSVNSTGTFLGMKDAIPEIRKAGGGAIVNISSISGVTGQRGIHVAYNASKRAVRTLTNAAAVQHGRDNIRVNRCIPGCCRRCGGPQPTAAPEKNGRNQRHLPALHRALPEPICRDQAAGRAAPGVNRCGCGSGPRTFRANRLLVGAVELKAANNGTFAMKDDIAIIEPTSTATTRQTEPEVVAGISSAEGSPDRPLWFGIGGMGIGMGRMLLMLGAGAALGYGGYRLWQARGSIF